MINKLLITNLIISSSLLLPTGVEASTFNKLQVFGDSISDASNFFLASGSTIPPSPPYAPGRFSNGAIWPDYLSSQLGIRVDNYAYGGATSFNRNVLDGLPFFFPTLPPDFSTSIFGLEQQIDQFITNNPAADSQDLYAIWIGSNDYLPTTTSDFIPQFTPTATLQNISNAINDLARVGARNILLFNLPDLGKLPRTRASLDNFCPPTNPFDADCLNQLTAAHNSGLADLVNSPPLGTDLTLVDVNGLFNRILADPDLFGYTNVTDACVTLDPFSLCPEPDRYFFWDDQHPSTISHTLIAQEVTQSLTVPEPSIWITIISMGLAMLVGRCR